MASTGINVAARRNCPGASALPGQTAPVGGLRMSDAIGSRHWRSAALSLVLGLLAIGTGAMPALAASTPFNATYPDEVTTHRDCPPGFPAGAFCFTGVGHGLTTPPGTVGTER